jgi:UDP-N-acetylglucosamine/UDP-N-acetylgalactosamine diphosphorylase
MNTLEDARRQLATIGQEHVLAFAAGLAPAERESLLTQVAQIDFATIPTLVREYVKNKPVFALPPDVAPASYYSKQPDSKVKPWDRAKARAAGEDLLRRGKIAAFVVAGGQGSRLGFDGPKGCFPAGAISGKSLFAFFADNLLAAKDRYGVSVPWYIMTSPQNHAPTVAFFEEHHFFGLSPRDVKFFPQGTLPSFDIITGKILLSSKGEIATNPDGHGGAIRALELSGSLADMKSRGVEHISYFQVDNPCVRVLDPVFIGLHASAPDSSAEMSSKMIPKAYAEEKLGLFCQSKGKTEVIEYSDLPMDRQRETLPDGSLRFIAGSIAIHMMSVEFVKRLASDPRFSLPYHRAEKKIPCVDPATGDTIAPVGNNGVKLERFVFDALPMCRGSIVMETDRLEEFAPIKNATGVDSVESSKQLQTERAAKWLETKGVAIPRHPATASPELRNKPDCVIELSPRTATYPEELAGKTFPKAIDRGTRITL